MLTLLFNQGYRGDPVGVTTGGGAHGGAAHWYRGKYKGELKAAITRAIRTLSKTTDKRKRKRIIRKVADVFVPEMGSVPTWAAPLDRAQIQIVMVARELRTLDRSHRAARLDQLIQDYEVKVKKREQEQEEEMVIAALLLAA